LTSSRASHIRNTFSDVVDPGIVLYILVRIRVSCL
jgi:hypothetical protein